jgi:hypothetical protein
MFVVQIYFSFFFVCTTNQSIKVYNRFIFLCLLYKSTLIINLLVNYTSDKLEKLISQLFNLLLRLLI